MAVSMLVACVPGTRGEHVREALNDVLNKLRNLASGLGPRESALDWVAAYLQWASDSARLLRFMISSEDIDRLVLTRRYELILNNLAVADEARLQRVFNGLLSTEIDHRVGALVSAVESIEKRLGMWSSIDTFVAVDTSFLYNSSGKTTIEEVKFAELLDVREQHIHVVVPMAVIDELDRLKENRNGEIRGPARKVLRVLHDRCGDIVGPALLHKEDCSALQDGGIPRGRVTVEIVPDPPQHARLPIDDDEIVHRVKSWEPLTPNGTITLLTYDTGQATRAHHAGLDVKKFDKEEPPQGHESESARKRGRAR